MKKIVCIMLCILLVFSLSACGGDVSEVNTHNVNSEIYIEVASGTSDTIGVTNISSIPVEVTAANLIVERVA